MQKVTPKDLREGLKVLSRNLPELIEYQAMFAVLVRARYLELTRAGFTEREALELCKHFNPAGVA